MPAIRGLYFDWNRFVDRVYVVLSTLVQERFVSLGLFGAEYYLEMWFF